MHGATVLTQRNRDIFHLYFAGSLIGYLDMQIPLVEITHDPGRIQLEDVCLLLFPFLFPSLEDAETVSYITKLLPGEKLKKGFEPRDLSTTTSKCQL